MRHTPTLWNVAFNPLLFWDGRAASLEEQVRFPVEHPDEMGDTLDNAAPRLSRRESYEGAFAAAFPDDPKVSARTIAKALAAYERTLISPPTRFDQWVGGDAGALTPSEVSGFKTFARQGPLHPLPLRFRLHRLRLLRHRPRRRRQGTRTGNQSRRCRPRLQDTNAARALLDRALYARRVARHPGGGGAPLRGGRRPATDAQQGPAPEPQAHRSGAGRSRRLPRNPLERNATAAIDRSLGRRRPAGGPATARRIPR